MEDEDERKKEEQREGEKFEGIQIKTNAGRAESTMCFEDGSRGGIKLKGLK